MKYSLSKDFIMTRTMEYNKLYCQLTVESTRFTVMLLSRILPLLRPLVRNGKVLLLSLFVIHLLTMSMYKHLSN